MKPADWGWVTLAVGVFVYEAAAALKRWEFLSEAADRYRGHHPIITVAIIAYLAAHLTRLIPKPLDPIHLVARRFR